MTRPAQAVPLKNEQRAPLLALFVVWAALLIAAMAVGRLGNGHGTPAATCLRMGSSVALVVAGWFAWACFMRSSAAIFALCMAIGMTLGAIGDFYNADLLNKVAPMGRGVLGGIAAFGLGHLFYISGCQIAARRTGCLKPGPRYGSLALWLAIAVIGWYAIAYLGATEKTSALVWPALIYSLLLATTAGLATGLAVQDRRFTMLAAGAALFFASDMILAIGMFRGSIAWQTEAVWLTYGPGQMLIVFSISPICQLLAAPSRGVPA